MRTTLILDEALIARARALTGLSEKTAVVHEGSGLAWVDVHLLCAARRERWILWSNDRRLAAAADLIM